MHDNYNNNDKNKNNMPRLSHIKLDYARTVTHIHSLAYLRGVNVANLPAP